MLKTEDIRVRDPFVLAEEDFYYLYATTGNFDFATPYMVPGYRMLCELEPRLQEGVNTSFDIFPMRYHSIGHWHLSLYNFLQKVF